MVCVSPFTHANNWGKKKVMTAVSMMKMLALPLSVSLIVLKILYITLCYDELISEMLFETFTLFARNLNYRTVARGEVALSLRAMDILEFLQVATTELIMSLRITIVHKHEFVRTDDWENR